VKKEGREEREIEGGKGDSLSRSFSVKIASSFMDVLHVERLARQGKINLNVTAY
jgi:hypothetical protein